MRTTVTLAADTDAYVRRLMRARNLTFGEALNEAIRAGVSAGRTRKAAYTRPKSMGAPVVPLDKALRLAAQLEDEEIIRKLALRK
jgi:hypothetical protein